MFEGERFSGIDTIYFKWGYVGLLIVVNLEVDRRRLSEFCWDGKVF